MYVVVGGAGEVGYHVARSLRDEGHDVCVVETNPERLERLADLDVTSVKGNIANKSILEGEAKVAEAQLFIACTGDDEVNMIACALAKTHGPRSCIRIHDGPRHAAAGDSLLQELTLVSRMGKMRATHAFVVQGGLIRHHFIGNVHRDAGTHATA